MGVAITGTWRHVGCVASAFFVLSGCGQSVEVTQPVAERHLEYERLPGWAEDDHAAALAAFLHSCGWFLQQPPDTPVRYGRLSGTMADWYPICIQAASLPAVDAVTARRFFERHFAPIPVENETDGIGLFTGYFAPVLRGSFERSDEFPVPLYARPDWRPGEPRPTRAEIAEGALADRGLELIWVDDPIDAFFLEIQGSGHVDLPDGRRIGVGYHGRNGHPYFPIGRELIDRGIVTREELSMDFIKDWLRENPEDAQSVLNLNQSYIFFELRDMDAVIGTIEVPLSAGRSLAVDRDFIPLGIPMWVEIDGDTVPGGSLRRLVMAQDTGGMIRGAVAGDLFWGYGPEAGRLASGMQAPGRYAMLVPRAVVAGTVAEGP